MSLLLCLCLTLSVSLYPCLGVVYDMYLCEFSIARAARVLSTASLHGKHRPKLVRLLNIESPWSNAGNCLLHNDEFLQLLSIHIQ